MWPGRLPFVAAIIVAGSLRAGVGRFRIMAPLTPARLMPWAAHMPAPHHGLGGTLNFLSQGGNRLETRRSPDPQTEAPAGIDPKHGSDWGPRIPIYMRGL